MASNWSASFWAIFRVLLAGPLIRKWALVAQIQRETAQSPYNVSTRSTILYPVANFNLILPSLGLTIPIPTISIQGQPRRLTRSKHRLQHDLRAFHGSLVSIVSANGRFSILDPASIKDRDRVPQPRHIQTNVLHRYDGIYVRKRSWSWKRVLAYCYASYESNSRKHHNDTREFRLMSMAVTKTHLNLKGLE